MPLLGTIFSTGRALKLGLSRSRTFSKQIRKMAKLLEKEDANRLVSSVDNFLFDCDGVLWDGKQPIEGSLETILKLKELGKRVYYVTNNSSKTRQDYVEKCRQWGFPADEDDVVCTAYIAAQYLKRQKFQGKVYLVGREESLGKELDNAGISYIGPGPDPVTSTEVSDWLQTELDPEVKCVLVGFDPYISYMKLLKAASYLKDPDCLYVGTNEDGCLPNKGRLCIPGTGCMVKQVSVASGREPIIVGKPKTGMWDLLQDIHKLNPSRSAMVGDSLHTDIVFGQKCGMKTLLVLSGFSKKEDIETKNIAPDLYADCLGCLGKVLP